MDLRVCERLREGAQDADIAIGNVQDGLGGIADKQTASGHTDARTTFKPDGTVDRLGSTDVYSAKMRANGQLKAIKMNPGEHGRGIELARAVTDKDVAKFNGLISFLTVWRQYEIIFHAINKMSMQGDSKDETVLQNKVRGG